MPDKLIEEYLRSVKNKGRSDVTMRVARLALTDLKSFLPRSQQDVREITKTDLEDYIIQLKQKTNRQTGAVLSVSFRNQFLFHIRSFFEFLAKNDYIMTDISRDLSRFKTEKRVPRNIFSKAELKRFFKAIDTKTLIGSRDYCVFRFLYHTGLRRSELVRLRLGDVNLSDGQIVVTGKFSKQRLVPLGRSIAAVLTEYLRDTRPKLARNNLAEEALFLSNRGTKLTGELLYRQTRLYAEKAGIKKQITPHSFRHTFATHLLNEGAGIRHIQEILGHENLDTTRIYTRVALNDLKEVYDRTHPRALGGFLSGEGDG